MVHKAKSHRLRLRDEHLEKQWPEECVTNGSMHETNVQVANTAEGPFARPRGRQWHGTPRFEWVWGAVVECKLMRELDGTLTTKTSLMNS